MCVSILYVLLHFNQNYRNICRNTKLFQTQVPVTNFDVAVVHKGNIFAGSVH